MAAEYAATDLAGEIEGLAAPQLEVLVPAVASLIARFEAVRLSALRAADRLRVGDRAGMRSTAEWAAAACGDKRGKARGVCELADKLAARPVFADAFASGAVSKAQAAALADAVEPSAAEQRGLVQEATSLSVGELERRVARFNHDRQTPPPEVVPSVSITSTKDGVKLEATLDPLGGEVVTTALDAAAQQLSFESGTPLTQRRAAGLSAISRYFLEHHSEVTHRLGRPHVVVTLPVEVLADDTAAGGATLGSGAVIDAGTARQLACDASVSRLITGPASEPLDIGRASRSTPTGIARVLIVEDRHCRWPGCEAPVWSCEGHHVTWWDGPYRGETKLQHLALLCWFHHHLLHKDRGWELHLTPETRRLTVSYRGRLVGVTDPPGRRRRSEPVPAPATATRQLLLSLNRPVRARSGRARRRGAVADDEVRGELDAERVDGLALGEPQHRASGEPAHLAQGLAHGGKRR
jgi:hypothetical protein